MYALNEKNYTVERFENIPSTNDYAKQKRCEEKNLLVIAKSQTGGRGTKGRSFSSEKGGVYLSRLTFYEHFPAKKAFTIMQSVAVAVCETLVEFGVKPEIKWPNDILVNGKKICGILIENTFSGDCVRSSIVGIGLNVCNLLPEELLSTATTLSAETGKELTVTEVEKKLLTKLLGDTILEKYAKYLGFVGEEVTLLCGNEQRRAVVLGVDAEGKLIAKTKKGEEKFSSAEVSVRSKR